MISNEILNFIDQTNDILVFNNLDNLQTIYHYSIPNVKLFYPEPFIASASFMHSDLWFMHILIYQYWLWFVFIFIIVFFFITFICTVRWCNMRVKPRRETRGVSRSKCGDLITACVPVSWATSIIVSESTDAIDYFDGFGTTELVIGIRAYQWGWEYYYPKDLDLNYNLKKNYSTFTGNSLKYEKSTELSSTSNNLWKLYQNKNSDQVVTPAFLLTLPFDNSKLFSFLNFNDIGSNSMQEANAFKKIKMFSKTHSSDLFFSSNNFSNKYKLLSALYIDENLFLDSFSYGLRRQHNFLSSKTLINSNTALLDLNSVNRLVNFNFKSNISKASLGNSSFFSTPSLSSNQIFDNKFDSLFRKNFMSQQLASFTNFSTYFDFINKINADSDKKKTPYSLFKLFNKKLIKSDYLSKQYLFKANSDLDSVLLKDTNEVFSSFFNNNQTSKKFQLRSPNQSISTADRNLRNNSNLKFNVSNLNHSTDLNTTASYANLLNNKFELSNSLFFDLTNAKWPDLSVTSRLSLARTSLEPFTAPITSSNLTVDSKNYDDQSSTFIEGFAPIFQGKEELTPLYLTSIYWNFYWNNVNPSWRLANSSKFVVTQNSFYLPVFNFYYDYDFRNWQAFELLEDAYWESAFSVYLHDEYLTLFNDFYAGDSSDKSLAFFNISNKNIVAEDLDAFVANDSFFKDSSEAGDFVAPYFYLEDSVNNTQLTVTKDFFIFPFSLNFNNSEDSYESFKNLNNFFGKVNNFSLLSNSIFFKSLPSSLVLDAFRSDFDEFSWIHEESFKDFNKIFNLFNESSLKLLRRSANQLPCLDLEWNPLEEDVVKERSSDLVNLRNTAKNSMVTYNAIQKVFRSRFDENRSNTKLNDFSNFFIKQPFVGSHKVVYEDMLGKNKKSYYSTVLFKDNFKPFFNNNYFTETSLNFYFYDFPFLMALKSDASRYLWFDWFAKWGFYEVQPSSSARYAIYGMPYFNKSFDYSSTANELLNESENYFLRLSRSRRNYLPNWVYTPYLYAKNKEWKKNNVFFETLSSRDNSLMATKFILSDMRWYWTKIFFLNFHNKQFFASHSGITSYNKTSWKPQNFMQSYYFTLASLADTLTKREYLYREFFVKTNKLISLPFYLTSSPSHPLMAELKSSFMLIDKIVLNNEYSRDIYFNSLNFFNHLVLKNLIENFSTSLNFKNTLDSLFFYFFNHKTSQDLKISTELYKNQYRPMKKGITNMVRLHATGAVAMPIEMRIQILASSKDVIHSWAIPSAGIKIDCVPGYSSHRVIIFLVSGIFWGQCMEVCGRYHHWMPIIVYFMKRDLFFLWCSHFIFLNTSTHTWNMNDRQNSDYVRLASFDKNSWLTELTKAN